MLVAEMIKILEGIRDTRGDIPVLIADRYMHYEVKWIDYSECQGKPKEHVCVRLDDDHLR